MQRNLETLNTIIRNYLEKHSLKCENQSWEIQNSKHNGFGIFARRSIEVGEIIFQDFPVILGPRAAPNCPPVCANCFSKNNLKQCESKCGLLICSETCKNSDTHIKECTLIRQWHTQPLSEELSIKLSKVLSPLRSLLLSEEDKDVVRSLKAHRSKQHGFEVDIMKNELKLNIQEHEEAFMRLVCSVLDTNAFELIVGNEEKQSSVKGLYPLGGLANHSCIPNTSHVFDQNQHMIVRAATCIPNGAEIFHTYTRLIWSTAARRFHLYRTKHFLCQCDRCKDPTELGSYISALLCQVCKNGRVVCMNPLSKIGRWQCEDCGDVLSRNVVANTNSLLGSVLNSFTDEDTTIMIRFLENKIPSLVPETNAVVVELKYKLIWTLGYHEGFRWNELSNELLLRKKQFCCDILKILETLKLGQCKMRGLLLYETFCCSKELSHRNNNNSSSIRKCYNETEMEHTFLEAADILRYDLQAPLLS